MDPKQKDMPIAAKNWTDLQAQDLHLQPVQVHSMILVLLAVMSDASQALQRTAFFECNLCT